MAMTTRPKRKRYTTKRRLRSLITISVVILFALATRYILKLIYWDPVAAAYTSSFPQHPTKSFIIQNASEVTSLENLASYGKLSHEPFCISWTFNVDSWWSDHPDWETALQNATHQCFCPISESNKAFFLRRLHKIQHGEACQDLFYKKISGSGWGSDMAHVVDGLQYAMTNHVPIIFVAPINWQYAVGKPPQLQTPPCATADLECYFLPLTSCVPDSHLVSWTRQHETVSFNFPWLGFMQPDSNAWLLQYATRPQTWLRRKAFRIAATTGLFETTAPCIAIHVRRNDVVRHGKFSRKYHRISEYLNAAQRAGRLKKDDNASILLLTDDTNAITEATSMFPKYHWSYIDRPRHYGNDGGWEHHVPSNDPVLEVAVLQASFMLLERCDTLVHSKSNLADYYFAVMQQSQPYAKRIDLDQGKSHTNIHDEHNSLSVKLSRGQ
ncbi:hypothetical protein MPSEU_000457400 [Mayamaea pseudoterrestris]|nr:hypothetical protein MPSEU_000457400 [Mayamaea pseudoterrestris]